MTSSTAMTPPPPPSHFHGGEVIYGRHMASLVVADLRSATSPTIIFRAPASTANPMRPSHAALSKQARLTVASSAAADPSRPCLPRHPAQLSARACPQRRRLPRPSRGIVRGDGHGSRSPLRRPRQRQHARDCPADAAGAPLSFLKAPREECPGTPDIGHNAGSSTAKASLRPLRGITRPAAGQRLRPQRKCPCGRHVAIRVRRWPHSDSQGRR